MLRGVLVLALVVVVVIGVGLARGHRHKAPPRPGPPNIVFVLTDDLSWNLVSHMPNVQSMMAQGATFDNYFVTDSLCCPSRASIFTGEFPHNTKVLRNTAPLGGWEEFHRGGDEKQVYARTLQQAGYRTGLIGKYLNGYQPSLGVPPYWDEWMAPGGAGGAAYSEYGYTANVDGKVTKRAGYQPSDYLTDVLSQRATGFIDQNAGQPFALEVSTFAPHSAVFGRHDDPNVRPGLAVPAPQDDDDAQCAEADFKAPRGPEFDAEQVDGPKWMSTAPLTETEIGELDLAYCKRAQAVESVDRMIGALKAELAKRGVLDNTYFVFSSDNGFHTGEHRLLAGKKTPYDEDISVPLVVVGPGIAPGTTIHELASNVDLAPTFDAIANQEIPRWVDGQSLLGLLHGERWGDSGWRKRVLVEHRHSADGGDDGPDNQPARAGDPPDYRALRSRNSLYVEYAPGRRGHGNKPEFYRSTDARFPTQLDNVYGSLSAKRKRQLHHMLLGFAACRGTKGGSSCWTRAGASLPPNLR